jgi:hypothetical protein
LANGSLSRKTILSRPGSEIPTVLSRLVCQGGPRYKTGALSNGAF